MPPRKPSRRYSSAKWALERSETKFVRKPPNFRPTCADDLLHLAFVQSMQGRNMTAN